MGNNSSFEKMRAEAFDKVIVLVEDRIASVMPTLVMNIQALTPEDIIQTSAHEACSLFKQGFLHLKDGAPKNQPGSFAGALTKTSLRSSSLAAALSIRPPQFEPILLEADYSNGFEAALFVSRKLVEASLEDADKSHQILQQKILKEKPVGAFCGEVDNDLLKKQMAFTLETLAACYKKTGVALQTEFENLK